MSKKDSVQKLIRQETAGRKKRAIRHARLKALNEAEARLRAADLALAEWKRTATLEERIERIEAHLGL